MHLVEYIDSDLILSVLPERKADTHKGDYGRILLLCGSEGYTGAAALAAMGALRSGAGVVYLGVPQSVYEIVAIKMLEPVVMPFPDNHGMFSAKATEKIQQLLPRMNAVLIGPGIGISEETKIVVDYVVRLYKIEAVVQ